MLEKAHIPYMPSQKMTFQCLADLELLTNFVLKIEKQNMSVTHQKVIFCAVM